jgi:hypothetical protein
LSNHKFSSNLIENRPGALRPGSGIAHLAR